MTAAHSAVTTDPEFGKTAGPVHHLSEDLLLDYASGALDEAASLFVVSHLTLCPDCRKELMRLEAVGGALFATMPPTDMSADALEKALAALDSSDLDGIPASASQKRSSDNSKISVLPQAVQKYIGGDVESLKWKRLGMGIETADIPLSSETGTNSGKRCFLLRVPPGKAVPQHTHTGTELVLILQGSYQDELGTFAKGDVAISDDTIDHRPVAAEGESCICLVVTDAPLRLTGPLGAIINLFVRV
ncbi:MAG: ChrR family anti-sigma-E factor [Alphaproteobacteria bacterium]|nr:ChrR family anti-sigma-E factor [Alphaproteobacteria bacterium]